jgi:hypothetical protein
LPIQIGVQKTNIMEVPLSGFMIEILFSATGVPQNLYSGSVARQKEEVGPSHIVPG